MPPHDDSQALTRRLVAQAQAGDQDAYDQLFERAADRLQLFLRVRLGAGLRQHEESRDLLQETYLAAHRAFGSFEPRGAGSFLRWLCQIAENQIRARADYHGAQKRDPGKLERVSRVIGRVLGGNTGVVTMAARSEQRERLCDALAELPADEREAMLMRHFEGREIAEIAERLGTSATSTRRALGRATLRLGDLLGAAGGDA